MSDCICALVKAAKQAALQPALHLPSPNSQLSELPPANDTVLTFREISDPLIDPERRNTANARCRVTRSAFDTHTVLNALLVAHAPDGSERVRTRGADFVPIPSTGTKKRLQPAVAASGFDPFK
jgi:hypothetical protein